jgi:hypothetical protein
MSTSPLGEAGDHLLTPEAAVRLGPAAGERPRDASAGRLSTSGTGVEVLARRRVPV